MDVDPIAKFFLNFGAAGALGYFLWLMIKERFADLKDRVSKLETKVDECEKDREELWKRISDAK